MAHYTRAMLQILLNIKMPSCTSEEQQSHGRTLTGSTPSTIWKQQTALYLLAAQQEALLCIFGIII